MLLCAKALAGQEFPLSQTGVGAERARVHLAEENLLVLELRIGDYVSSDSLFVYQSPDETLIPLQPLLEALDFPVSIDMDTLSLSGWYIEEERRISADILQQRLFLRGMQQAWPERLHYAADDFDLYLDLGTIEQWFELHLDLDVSQLRLGVSSSLTLPVLARLEREKRRENLPKETNRQRIGIDINNRYSWLGKPQFDAGFSLDAAQSQGQSESSYSGVLQGRMDLLKHSMQLSYYEDDRQREARIRMSRAAASPDQQVLPGFDRYEFGDIQSYSDPLIFSAINGRGLALQRGRDQVNQQGSSINIEGDATPGWEAELYRNGQLIAFSEVGLDGRYLFEEVVTSLGQNNFEVRLYGPQGQFRVSKKQLSIGGEMLPAGEVEAQLVALDRNSMLLESEPPSSKETSDFQLAELGLGINEYVTAQLGLSNMTPANGQNAYLYRYFNLFASVWGLQNQFKLASDGEGGIAWLESVKGRVGSSSLNLDWKVFDDFVSDRNPQGLLERDVGVDLSNSVRMGLPSPMYFIFGVRQQSFSDGRKLVRYSNDLSSRLAGIKFAHNAVWTDSNEDEPASLSGQLSVTTQWYDWRLKGSAAYRARPTGRMDNLSLGASYLGMENFSYTGSAQYLFGAASSARIDNTFTWDLKGVSVSVNASVTTEDYYSLGLSLNTALGYDYADRAYAFNLRSQVNNASVTALAFIDENGDGIKGPDEAAVEHIRFKGIGHWRHAETNADGLVTLAGLPELAVQTIEVDEKSIEDPFIRVARPPVTIYTHAGTHHFLQIPLVQTLEIEGQLNLVLDERTLPATGVEVHLLDQQGQIISTTTTEYDGVYLFEQILPGTYFMQIDPLWLKARKVTNIEPVRVNATGEDGIIFIDPLILERKSEG